MDNLIVVGIHTDAGKSVVSAALVEAFGMDYWKPVQAGITPHTDTEWVKSMVTRTDVTFHSEGVVLKHPMSPHAAAALEGRKYAINDLQLPNTNRPLLIETAGGLMSPISNNETALDFVKALRFPVVVVARMYLGAINHTLLTLQALQQHNIHVLGVIINEPDAMGAAFIEKYGGISTYEFPTIHNISPATIQVAALQLKSLLKWKV